MKQIVVALAALAAFGAANPRSPRPSIRRDQNS